MSEPKLIYIRKGLSKVIMYYDIFYNYTHVQYVVPVCYDIFAMVFLFYQHNQLSIITALFILKFLSCAIFNILDCSKDIRSQESRCRLALLQR